MLNCDIYNSYGITVLLLEFLYVMIECGNHEMFVDRLRMQVKLNVLMIKD